MIFLKFRTCFVKQGRYEAGQLVFQFRKPAGISELTFQGEISSVEGGEKSVFERVVPLSGVADDKNEVAVVLPSGLLFDALLTVTNDENDNIDQIYIADGPWGKIQDQEDDTDIEVFQSIGTGETMTQATGCL